MCLGVKRIRLGSEKLAREDHPESGSICVCDKVSKNMVLTSPEGGLGWAQLPEGDSGLRLLNSF